LLQRIVIREKKKEEGGGKNNTFSPCQSEAPFVGKHIFSKLLSLHASMRDKFPTETSFCLALGDRQ